MIFRSEEAGERSEALAPDSSLLAPKKN